jgi:uncharacterized protein (UPF0332 family)
VIIDKKLALLYHGIMSYSDKIIENQNVAKKCLDMGAYNVGVSRAYYSAFLTAKMFLLDNNFDYDDYLKNKGSSDKAFSHGTIQSALVSCLMGKGKKITEIFKLNVLDNLYAKRRQADYNYENKVKAELVDSLHELDTVISILC